LFFFPTGLNLNFNTQLHRGVVQDVLWPIRHYHGLPGARVGDKDDTRYPQTLANTSCIYDSWLRTHTSAIYYIYLLFQVRAIRKKMVETITEEIVKSDLKEVVNKLRPDSIAKEIEKKCQSIYPLHDVFIRKVLSSFNLLIKYIFML